MRKKGSKKWVTAEQIATAGLLAGNGLSIQKIADALNLSYATVFTMKRAEYDFAKYKELRNPKKDREQAAIGEDNSILLELIAIKNILRMIEQNTSKKKTFFS